MKKIKIIILMLFAFAYSMNGQDIKDDRIPFAPKEYRRPDGYDPQEHSFKYTLNELKDKYSERMMHKSALRVDSVQRVIDNGKWKATAESIDNHSSPEWFSDAKFGMFIDWGLFSVPGWAPMYQNRAMYPDWYEHRMYNDSITKLYHAKNWGNDFERDDFIPFFSDRDYNPKKLVDIASEAGMKYVVPFAKHHSGFCLWPSSYTQRDVSDMIASGKDMIAPIVDACKRKKLKFGFYFSLDEYEFPTIDEKGNLTYNKWSGIRNLPYDKSLEKKASGKVAVRDYAKDYLIPQATEFIDKYDPDLVWFDGEVETSQEYLKTFDITAYYYNQAEGRKEVAVNDRLGWYNGKRQRFLRGDFYTSEYSSHKADNSSRPWEECRGISQFYGFSWQDSEANVLSTPKFIEKFLQIVSNGGNLLLMVNLDAKGALPIYQEKRMKDIGKWLKVNGEGIYSTRTYSVRSEANIYYTRSKDNKTVYAISIGWPGKRINLKSVAPKKGSKVYMLGFDKPLKWSVENGLTTIILPEKLQKETHRPCEHAFTFRILKE